MLQFPAFMTEFPSTAFKIPAPIQHCPNTHNDELLLAKEEADYEEKCSEIRKINSNITIIGRTIVENDKEDFDNDGDDDDDADNPEESEGEFEQETGAYDCHLAHDISLPLRS